MEFFKQVPKGYDFFPWFCRDSCSFKTSNNILTSTQKKSNSSIAHYKGEVKKLTSIS